MENNEKLTEYLIENLSETQLARIADRIKNKPAEKPQRPIPPVIDPAEERKRMFDAAFRRTLRKILKECFFLQQMISPDEMSFVREIKQKFIQNESVAKEEAKRLNEILRRVRGY